LHEHPRALAGPSIRQRVVKQRPDEPGRRVSTGAQSFRGLRPRESGPLEHMLALDALSLRWLSSATLPVPPGANTG
jgi:hypothetical protein